jgi:hypothetical protein
VVIRMRAPAEAISPMIRSTSRLLAGSRLAVGSSRISSSRFQRPGARQRHALLLAAGQQARRARRQVFESDAGQGGAREAFAVARSMTLEA